MARVRTPTTVDEWIEELQPEVAYCLNCQARDSGEWIWVLGDRAGMDDLLREFDVPESLWGEVAGGLTCGNCGTELDRLSDIGRPSAEERRWNAMYEEWRRLYVPRLDDFVDWLTKHPYLGAHHELGREFIAGIPEFPARSWEDSQTWFRSRPAWGCELPQPEDLGPPTDPPQSEGRFSHHGQVVFYLADDEKTAAAEALGRPEGITWIQEYSLTSIEGLLDLNGIQGPDDVEGAPILAAGMNWTRAHTEEAPSSEWKPQYFLPRFIADCARAAGYSGIVYPSTRFYGECLVLFDWQVDSISAIGRPRLLQWDAKIAESEMPF